MKHSELIPCTPSGSFLFLLKELLKVGVENIKIKTANENLRCFTPPVFFCLFSLFYEIISYVYIQNRD